MKFFKGLLIVIVGLVVLFLLIGIFLPSQYRVERQITIKAPIDSVFNNALDLHTVLLWNPWTAMDSAAVTPSQVPVKIQAIYGNGKVKLSELAR